MAVKNKSASVKRFGPRYGRTTRTKVARVESTQKAVHECPYCSKKSVKRVFAGVWACSKCGSKFTGKAYDFDRKKMLDRMNQKVEA